MDTKPAMRNLFKQIKHERESQAIHLRQLAIDADIDISHYGKSERYGSNCCLHIFLIICLQLKLKPWELMEKALKDIWEQMERDYRKR